MRPALLAGPGERGGAPLANSNADDRESRGVELAPADAQYAQQAGGLEARSELAPNIIEQSPTGPESGVERPTPGTRPARHNEAWTLRPFDKWAAESFSGIHGLVTVSPGDSQYGGMLPWDEQRRSLRDLPTESWDAGIVINPAGATGIER